MLVGLLIGSVLLSRQPTALKTAAELSSACKAAVSSDAADYKSGICIGYLEGYLDMAAMWQVVAMKKEADAPMFCLTSKVTIEAVARELPIHLIEHPEDATHSALEVVTSMLVERYPCKR